MAISLKYEVFNGEFSYRNGTIPANNFNNILN